ncbi:Uncharacterised protein [Streptococcus agalactiae]|nr:Uncharacterised protein [Streptococcus agalactiae]
MPELSKRRQRQLKAQGYDLAFSQSHSASRKY